MARDGTARGGARTGSGRKSKSLQEKVANGNPGHKKLKVMDLPESADLDGLDMPEPKDYMKAKQKVGNDLCAVDVFRETWKWLKECGCDKFVTTQLVEQYAMSVSRWIQCEDAISEYGFIAKHPTTGGACSSPYVQMAQNYMKQVNQTWFQIYQIVKESCTSDFNAPIDDPMEMLLRARN